MQSTAVVETAASGPAGCGAGLVPEVAVPMVRGLCDFALGNLQAVAKAGDIWARGFRLLNTAVIGNAWMTVDDSICELQARMSCGGLGELVELETDVSRRTISRTIHRFCVLARMAGQLGEDALVPLQRRIDVAFDSLSGLATRLPPSGQIPGRPA